jgi:hypothetical protein
MSTPTPPVSRQPDPMTDDETVAWLDDCITAYVSGVTPIPLPNPPRPIPTNWQRFIDELAAIWAAWRAQEPPIVIDPGPVGGP